MEGAATAGGWRLGALSGRVVLRMGRSDGVVSLGGRCSLRHGVLRRGGRGLLLRRSRGGPARRAAADGVIDRLSLPRPLRDRSLQPDQHSTERPARLSLYADRGPLI